MAEPGAGICGFSALSGVGFHHGAVGETGCACPARKGFDFLLDFAGFRQLADAAFVSFGQPLPALPDWRKLR